MNAETRFKTVIVIYFILFISCIGISIHILHSLSVRLPFSSFIKLDEPILLPSAIGLDSGVVFNPAVVFVNGTF